MFVSNKLESRTEVQKISFDLGMFEASIFEWNRRSKSIGTSNIIHMFGHWFTFNITIYAIRK